MAATRSCSCGSCSKCKDRERKKARYATMTLKEKRDKAARRNQARRRASQRAAHERHKLRNPEKVKARKAVQSAIGRGKLQRGFCEFCGPALTPRRIDGEYDTGAHHEDYSKPLEVRWFCYPHHKWFEKRKGKAV